MGCGTRTELKKLIRSGKVCMHTPDGDKCCKDPSTKISEDTELVIRTEGSGSLHIIYEEYQYFLLNKPQGIVSAVTDPIHETVTDICRGYEEENFCCCDLLKFCDIQECVLVFFLTL